uniref:Peptidase S1 domain-containing protein n=2 Tax=Anopheles gambiae TaxID=7165 RepID=A0A2C9H3V6_ANOGA
MSRSLDWFPLLLCLLCVVVSQTHAQNNHLTCGKRKVKSEYLIQNGIDAKAGHWPWHVAIFHATSGRMGYACGGSIIDESTILTASHCVYTKSGVLSVSRVSVDVGRIHLNETSNYTQTHAVRQIIVHPRFSQHSIINDIALIKLRTNITMSKYVQPVCLWTMDSNQTLIVGRSGTIVGFGLNERDVVSDQLKQALVGVQDGLTCIASDRDVFGTHLTTDMFCGMGQNGASACNGDSGGGMFFEVGGKWYVRGLVSFTPLNANTKPCDPRKNTAYTDVAKYLDWIKQYIDQRVLSFENDVLHVDYEEKLRLFNFETCGLKSYSTGNNVSSWTLPWLGFVKTPNIVVPRCTITLISDSYAVGSAHCLDNVGSEAFIVLGSLSEYSKDECFVPNGTTICTHAAQVRGMQRIILHPKFDRNTYANNIALIELLSPADTTQSYVQPICMPVTSELRSNAKTNLHVAAFLKDEQTYTTLLVRYIESVDCVRRYSERQIRLNLDSNQFCAEIVNKLEEQYCIPLNKIAMPAGVPLQEKKIFNGTERYFLRGVEFHGSDCESVVPSIYNDVEAYLDWILYNMRYSMLDTTGDARIFTTNQTLQSEWSNVRQQPGKEKLRLFNMDTCGLVNKGADIIPQLTFIPWHGILWDSESVTRLSLSVRSTVVLISEWYALAPKFIVQNDAYWRIVVLGLQPHTLTNCTPSTCEQTHQLVEIKNIILPSPINNSRQMFALLEFVEPANLNIPYIRPICLPFMNQLYKHVPSNMIMSSYYNNILSKRIALIDTPTCQQRFLVERFYFEFNNLTVECAVEEEMFRQMPLPATLGSLLQMPVRYGGKTQYFLYAINTVYPASFDFLVFGPYLFTRFEMDNIEWILENMEEKVRQTSFLTTTGNTRVNLKPVQHASSQALFDFNTCGESSPSYLTPWTGGVYYDKLEFEGGTGLVTLINEWYAVGPASCFDNSSAQFIIVFGFFGKAIEIECDMTNNTELCNVPPQSVTVQKVFNHPLYNGTRNHDIALVKLATRVDTSRPNVKPICLPITDAIRSYDVSNLVMRKSSFELTKVDDRYVDTEECQKRWQGLKVRFAVDESKHCVIQQRTMEETCITINAGDSLQSLQTMASGDRHFLRGFVIARPSHCSIYYPVVYTNTDTYLDWILKIMEQPADLPFDLRDKLIFNKK